MNGRDEIGERDKRLLYSLIELRNRDESVFGKFKRLAASGGDLRAAMLALEERLDPKPEAGRGGAVAAKPPDSLTGEEWEMFCAGVARSTPLRELFSSDLWRGADEDLPRVVATLAEFADLTPDPKQGCRSRDEAFMAALEDAGKKNVPDAAALLVEVVADLIRLIYDHREIASKLDKLADPAYWRDVLKRLETGQAAGDDLPDEAAKNFKETLGLLKDVPQAVRSTLFRGMRMSQRVSPALFRLAWKSRPEFDAALELLTEADVALELTRRRRRQAEEAIKLLRAKPEAKALLDRTEAEIKLRFLAAQHLLGVRERVKRDALVHGWPEAGLLAMSNLQALREVEGLILANRGVLPPPPAAFQYEESQGLYDICKAEPTLVRFLRLIPHYSGMEIGELAGGEAAEALRSEAETVIQSRSAATPTTAAGTTEAKAEPAPPTPPPVTDTTGAGADARPATPEPQPALSATLHIIRPVGRDKDAPSQVYECGFSFDDRPPVLFTSEPRVPPKLLLTGHILPALRIPAEGETHRYLEEMFDLPDAPQRIQRAGLTLWEWVDLLLSAQNEREALNSLNEFALAAGDGGRKVRFFINTNDERVAALPWEWLVLLPDEEVFSRRRNCSLLRSAPGKKPGPQGILYPLRIMAVSSGQNEQAQKRALRKLSRLSNTWTKGEPTEATQVNILSDLNTKITSDNFTSLFYDSAPHVLYLETPVVRKVSTPAGGWESYVVLGSLETEWLSADHLVKTLADSEIQLVVFGDNPTGGFDENPLLDLVFELMRGGLPAALVPTRPTQDGPSVRFLHNFFGAWLSGLPLEESVTVARGVLDSERGDWSAYALFAREEALPKLRVTPPPAA
jgi:hypothetical protein